MTQLMLTAKGATGKKSKRVRISLGEDEILGIDDFGEENSWASSSPFFFF